MRCRQPELPKKSSRNAKPDIGHPPAYSHRKVQLVFSRPTRISALLDGFVDRLDRSWLSLRPAEMGPGCVKTSTKNRRVRFYVDSKKVRQVYRARIQVGARFLNHFSITFTSREFLQSMGRRRPLDKLRVAGQKGSGPTSSAKP